MDKQFLNKPLCFTTINGFSCQEENQKHFFDLIIVCSIVSFSVMILAAVIMIYRYNYGLFTGFFQYVKGYRIPKPINTLLTVIFISKLSRFISLVLLLFDVPNVARIRVVLNYLGTLPISLGSAEFILGIIIYIPLLFSTQFLPIHHFETESSDESDKGKEEDAISMPRLVFAIYTPSIRTIYLANVFSFSVSIIVGITLATLRIVAMCYHNEDLFTIANYSDVVMLFTGSFILSVASGYYLYGFHCLVHECAHQLSDNKIMSTMMQTAARNLRNLFFGLFIGFSGLIVFSTIIGTISAYILNVRLQVIDILIQEVFIYPIIHIAMLIIILKSSMNQVRYKKALIEKNTSKENSIKASNSCNLCDANNNGASTVMSLPVHLDDITLIWQSFIRPCPAVESPSMYHNIV